jgi:riboflavin biosynthesis pyrimidine reductase
MEAQTGSKGSTQERPALQRLVAEGELQSAAALVEQLAPWKRGPATSGRPRVMANMVSTVDGRARVDGRSGAISGPADRELFHALRAGVDAVLVGAGTARAERYGRIVSDPERRALRARRGLAEEALACIVSESLELEGVPLLEEPAARVAILTAASASLTPHAAAIEYVRAPRDGGLDLAAALAQLYERFAVASVLCEGGPHLIYQLLAAGLLDELFLSLSPKLAGDEDDGGALRILAGGALTPPVELELAEVLRSGSYLFLRYSVAAPARVSRETTASSSLAR